MRRQLAERAGMREAVLAQLLRHEARYQPEPELQLLACVLHTRSLATTPKAWI